MRLTIEGIGPDISRVRDHIEPGLRRVKLHLETADTSVSEGNGVADISLIFRVDDTASHQDADELCRKAAAQFFRRAADKLDAE